MLLENTTNQAIQICLPSQHILPRTHSLRRHSAYKRKEVFHQATRPTEFRAISNIPVRNAWTDNAAVCPVAGAVMLPMKPLQYPPAISLSIGIDQRAPNSNYEVITFYAWNASTMLEYKLFSNSKTRKIIWNERVGNLEFAALASCLLSYLSFCVQCVNGYKSPNHKPLKVQQRWREQHPVLHYVETAYATWAISGYQLPSEGCLTTALAFHSFT